MVWAYTRGQRVSKSNQLRTVMLASQSFPSFGMGSFMIDRCTEGKRGN
jgi:hypothetical protein